MDLKDFTKQTLAQIVEGAHEANKYLAERGGRVHVDKPNPCGRGKVSKIIDVDFDVAVTTNAIEEANGGGGIKVAGLINIGGNVDNKIEHQTISRVKYTLQLELSTNE